MFQSLQNQTGTIRLDYDANKWDSFALIPWYSYRVNMPLRPLPSYTHRAHMRTRRLIIRPILMSDLDALHELRSRPETQNHSTARGRPDRDINETRRFINRMHAEEEFGNGNWYFGIFLATSDSDLEKEGEMIGEGGLPDLANSTGGWPEVEILLRKEYWRQGYGSEFWAVFARSWWDLPRTVQRHQLMPAIVPPGSEPGDVLHEGIGFVCEAGNVAAQEFFANVIMRGKKLELMGSLENLDVREGRLGQLVRWFGMHVPNPNEMPRAISPDPSLTPSPPLED